MKKQILAKNVMHFSNSYLLLLSESKFGIWLHAHFDPKSGACASLIIVRMMQVLGWLFRSHVRHLLIEQRQKEKRTCAQLLLLITSELPCLTLCLSNNSFRVYWPARTLLVFLPLVHINTRRSAKCVSIACHSLYKEPFASLTSRLPAAENRSVSIHFCFDANDYSRNDSYRSPRNSI